MKGNKNDLGMFEGFNFRDQCAIDRVLTAQEVFDWDHDADGEAEFWPDGSNFFVQKLLPDSSCTAEEIRQVGRIFNELDAEPIGLAKAVYLRNRGDEVEEISRAAVEGSYLYVFGPGSFVDLRKEAAYELFDLFWPESYTIWVQNNVPGLLFHVENFMSHFSTLELTLPAGGYLIVDTE